MEITEAVLTEVICQRPAVSHKGTFGRCVLLGGDQHYGGAIIMSAQAAVNSGCGLTTVVTAAKNHGPLHARLPEAMVVDFEETARIKAVLAAADVILIGPGLGLELAAAELLQLVLAQQQARQWLVVDGSAITLFAENSLKLPYPEQTVFTPHALEWQRLSGLEPAEQTKVRNQAARDALQSIIVLKGHRSQIYSRQPLLKNTVGTPAMATGGMGDTLAGMIAAFLAQFAKTERTVAAALYLHSLIGEALGQEHYVVLPTQISACLPQYMKRYEQRM